MANILQRILILDDVPEYLHSIKLALNNYFEIDAVGSLKEAMAAYGKNRPDAALVDVRLDESIANDRSGMDFVRWLKSQSIGIPVIVMSALDDPSLPSEASVAGADAFLKKPINLFELRKEIENSIRSKRNKSSFGSSRSR